MPEHFPIVLTTPKLKETKIKVLILNFFLFPSLSQLSHIVSPPCLFFVQYIFLKYFIIWQGLYAGQSNSYHRQVMISLVETTCEKKCVLFLKQYRNTTDLRNLTFLRSCTLERAHKIHKFIWSRLEGFKEQFLCITKNNKKACKIFYIMFLDLL